MSIRRFCDVCGNATSTPTQLYVDKYFNHPGVLVRVKISRAVGDTWNGGDVCDPCLRVVIEGSWTNGLDK